MPREILFNSLRSFRPPQGRKQVWLPNITLTLLRTPHLPPNMASFIVPLNINKLDLKDYLWHAYRIPVLAVRSSIKQQPIRQDKPGTKFFKPRRWHRPRAIKTMTIEIADEIHMVDSAGGKVEGKGGPFVWPKEEEDYSSWDKDIFDQAQKAQNRMARDDGEGQLAPKRDGEALRRQAEALQRGKVEWKPTWMDMGGKKK